MLQKKCTRCESVKLLHEFRLRTRINKNGVVYYHESWCKKCESSKIAEIAKIKLKKLKKNTEKYNQYLIHSRKANRKSQLKSIDELSDTWVGFLLGLKAKEAKMFPELIEAKRNQMKLYRKLNPNHKNRK